MKVIQCVIIKIALLYKILIQESLKDKITQGWEL